MKINEETTKERLDGLSPSQKVYIYDGRNVLEFLNRTFIPTSHFIVKDAEIHVRDLKNNDWCEGKKGIRVHTMKLSELYELYVAFHTAMHYTFPIETPFKFGLIIRRLRYYKNAWEFDVYRVGSAQLWYVAPLLARVDAPELSLIKARRTDETVDVKFEDMQSDQEESDEKNLKDEPSMQILQNGFTTQYTEERNRCEGCGNLPCASGAGHCHSDGCTNEGEITSACYNDLKIKVNEEQTEAIITPTYVEPLPIEETPRVEEVQTSPSPEEVFFPEEVGEIPQPIEAIDEDLSLLAPPVVEKVEEVEEDGEVYAAELTDY